MEEHLITIDQDGNIQIAVKGVKGKSCKDATRAIEKALGETTNDKLTGEYYEQQQHNVNRR
jgi:hypothetical protein